MEISNKTTMKNNFLAVISLRNAFINSCPDFYSFLFLSLTFTSSSFTWLWLYFTQIWREGGGGGLQVFIFAAKKFGIKNKNSVVELGTSLK
jgi:hypothetical protein